MTSPSSVGEGPVAGEIAKSLSCKWPDSQVNKCRKKLSYVSCDLSTHKEQFCTQLKLNSYQSEFCSPFSIVFAWYNFPTPT